MSKKILFLFLGVSLLVLNEVRAEKYECYLSTDVKFKNRIGEPINSIGNPQENLCNKYSDCEPPKRCIPKKM